MSDRRMTDACEPAPIVLDLRGLRCPLPVLRTRKALRAAEPGTRLLVFADDPLAAADIPHFIRGSGDDLESVEQAAASWRFTIRRAPSAAPGEALSETG